MGDGSDAPGSERRLGSTGFGRFDSSVPDSESVFRSVALLHRALDVTRRLTRGVAARCRYFVPPELGSDGLEQLLGDVEVGVDLLHVVELL